MKLQHKAWALVLVIVGLAAAGSMLGVRTLVVDSFDALEAERAGREGERARRMLDQQLAELEASAKDYAYWSDAVDFAKGKPNDFMDEQFDAGSLVNMRFSEVLVFDAQGRLVSGVRSVSDEALGPVAPERIAQLKALLPPVLADATGLGTVQTYLASGDRLDMLAIVAIRDPDVSSAPQGAIALVRYFDDVAIKRFSDVLMVPVHLVFDSTGPGGAKAHLDAPSPLHYDFHAVVRGADGVKVAELVLTLEKDLQKIGGSMAWKAMAVALAFGLLACLLLVILLDRLLLRRLQGVHDDLKNITDQGPSASGQIRVVGSDELSALATGLNRLLARVRSDAAEQKTSYDRQEALQLQLMQSQKTEALGRFTAGIAHDFNNSLAAIGGWMRLADEDLDRNHPSHEALQHALKATRYANGIMRQLLAFSRQSKPNLEDLLVGDLIEESRLLLASGLLKTCELVVHHPEEPLWIRADLTQMQQVLVNLVMNASDAMGGAGRIWLSVESRTLPIAADEVLPEGAAALAPGRYVCLTVRDEGPGIAPEHLSHIFDPFFTTKTVGKGTGLGLSVAHGIMARHGGAIGVSSETGVGTSLHLYLPACEAPAELDGALVIPSDNPGTSRQLLFVDDDQLVRHAWGTLLERQGWVVTRARDGEEAWNLFQRSPLGWAVVLTDLTMPKLDGIGLAQRIAATASPPPVVLMSGNVSAEDAALLVKTDFVAVLNKPVDIDQLNEVLKGALLPKA